MAKIIDVIIRKKKQWGEDAGKEYIVEPEEIPIDDVFDATEFIERLYPKHHIVRIIREKIFGQTSFKYEEGTYSLFFKTLQTCFNKHLPFALRPEVLWYLIVHEVAQAVKLQPERYRHHFTSVDDKEVIEIFTDESLPTEWAPFIKQFVDQISDKMPSDISKLLLTSFSTSSLESDVATNIAFMDAASPFYDYRMQLCCGLPSIRLDGNPEDYQELVDRAKILKVIFGKDLGLYFTYLIPVLEKIAEQSSEESVIDHEFWGAIYNHESGSGGSDGSDDLGGWITTFINYIRAIDDDDNVYIEPKPKHVYDWTQKQRWLTIGMVPNHVSSADFVLTALNNPIEVPMKFIGGILGVEIDNNFVSPQLSYVVLVDDEYLEQITDRSK